MNKIISLNSSCYNYSPIKIKEKHTTSPNFGNEINDYLIGGKALAYENRYILNPPPENINPIKRPPFRESTLQKFETMYENYKNSLNEISREDIKNAVDNIEKTTDYSREEILSAMQKATQFANMESIITIGQKMLNDLSYIPLSHDKIGLNVTLYYFMEEKKLYPEPYGRPAIFLDNNKLEILETNEEQKEIHEKLNKKNLTNVYILSGFNNGINFLNRDKDLEATTREILKLKDIDEKTIERAKKIGLNPIIIRNDNPATIENIYNQTRPKQMTKDEFKAVIDANAMTRFSSPDSQIKSKDAIVQYLTNTLNIYTPEKLSRLSKQMYNKLETEIKNTGKSMENVYYLIPNNQKSYVPITHQYQLINNIPQDKFITYEELLDKKKKIDIKDKTIVILDDCAISGESIFAEEKKLATIKNINKSNIIFAPFYASNEAISTIDEAIYTTHREDKDKVIYLETENCRWDENITVEDIILYNSLGDMGFENANYCIIFPYMCPDNNSEFASNIGILHSIGGYYKNTSIKSYVGYAQKVASLALDLICEEGK